MRPSSVNNDFILTDNHFGDTDHSDGTTVNSRSTSGESSAIQPTVCVNSLNMDWRVRTRIPLRGSRPGAGIAPRAVLASWEGRTSTLPAAGASLLDQVDNWGYSASMDFMVDNDDWRRADLLGALRDRSSRSFCTPTTATRTAICAPEASKKTREGQHLWVDPGRHDRRLGSLHRPFYGFGGLQGQV